MIAVKEIMNKGFSKIASSGSVELASKLMDEKKTDYLVIEDKGKTKGVVTSRGLLGYPSSRIILDCGITETAFISEETFLDEALRILDEKKVSFLVVLNDENAAAGVINGNLIISFLYQELKKTCKEKEKIIADITKVNEAIKQVVKEWDRTFNAIADWIFIIDKDFTITRVNKAFAEALKSNPEDIVGKKCYELLHKMDKPWPGCPFEMTKKDKQAHIQEVDDPNIGVPLLVTTSPVFGGDGELLGAVHIAKDITEIKAAKEKEAKAYKELEAAQIHVVQASKLATLGEMSAGLAHEINQPLSGIALTVKKLRKLIDSDSLTKGEIEAAVRDIESSQERITKIIQHIRIFARQDSFKFIELDATEPIENALSLLGEQLRLHEIEIGTEYSPDVLQVNGEPYQLEQVIINIISNARDALDEKGRMNEKGYLKKLIIKTEKIKDEACVSISDNGAGMTEEVKEKIFQPFFTTKEEGRATGLGMSISYGIIESHKGRIELESEKDKGTTVRVFLPIRTVPEN